jgi:hypothetical protein
VLYGVLCAVWFGVMKEYVTTTQITEERKHYPHFMTYKNRGTVFILRPVFMHHGNCTENVSQSANNCC